MMIVVGGLYRHIKDPLMDLYGIFRVTGVKDDFVYFTFLEDGGHPVDNSYVEYIPDFKRKYVRYVDLDQELLDL